MSYLEEPQNKFCDVCEKKIDDCICNPCEHWVIEDHACVECGEVK